MGLSPGTGGCVSIADGLLTGRPTPCLSGVSGDGSEGCAERSQLAWIKWEIHSRLFIISNLAL